MPLNVYYDEFQPSWEEEGLFARDVNGQLVRVVDASEREREASAQPARWTTPTSARIESNVFIAASASVAEPCVDEQRVVVG